MIDQPNTGENPKSDEAAFRGRSEKLSFAGQNPPERSAPIQLDPETIIEQSETPRSGKLANELQGKKPEVPNKKSIVRPLRTFRDDISSLIQKGGVTYLGAATAELKRGGDAMGVAARFSRKNLALAGSAFLVLAGIGFIVWSIFFTGPSEPVAPGGVILSPFILTESKEALDITDKNRNEILSLLMVKKQGAAPTIGAMSYLYFTKEMPAGPVLVGANELLRTLETRVPAAMLRALSDIFMFGFHEANGNQPYLILKTTDFKQSFSGMLAWEPYMRQDLSPLFLTGTATTSVEGFRDRIIRNKDTRLLLAPDGSIALLYSLIDQETILITSNEQTFAEILNRLSTSQIR